MYVLAKLALVLGTVLLALVALVRSSHGGPPPGHPSDLDSARFKFREQLFSQSLTVEAPTVVRIAIPDAGLRLEPGDGRTLEVAVEVAGTDAGWARRFFEEMGFTVEHRSGAVSITGGSNRHFKSYWKSGHQTEIQATVRLPELADLEVVTEDGDVSVTGIQGALVIRTEDGRVEVADARCKSLEVETSDGPITIRSLSTRTGARLTTSDADVDVAGIDGRLRVSTDDGDVRVELGAIDRLSVDSQEGDLEILAPASLGLDLDLEAEHVSVGRAVSVDGRVDRRRVEGTVNGGGALLRARSSEGTIHLARLD